VFVDDFDKCVIRNTIQDFYIQGKKSANNTEAATHYKKEITFSLGTQVIGEDCKEPRIQMEKMPVETKNSDRDSRHC
jgi:hypothetical protein